MNVLIIGGAGYIGSHVNKYFHQHGIETVVLDNLSRGNQAALKWGVFYQGDCGDQAILSKIFTEHHIDVVLHFAAFAYVGESVAQPGLYYENNVAQTLVLLNTMVRHGVKNMVFSSTCASFGTALQLPIDELHVQNPINPYGRSKLMVEWILKDFDAAYGLKHCIFRYFNAAGCDPEGEIGEDHDPEPHLIPLVLRHLKTGAGTIEIFGKDYETLDGTCIRDYIHVNDLADAHLKGMEKMIETNVSNAYNLGNGVGYSVKEIIGAAEKVTGKTAQIVIKPRRPGDPSALVGSGQKALSELGWVPKHKNIEDILRTAWNWEQRKQTL